MSLRDEYNAYYEAFEVAFDNDDWSPIEKFFAEDAVYEAPRGGKVEGRKAVMAQFKESLDAFDRTFPVKRVIEVHEEKVEVSEDYIRVPGTIHYRLPGEESLAFEMIEEAWYKGNEIVRLVDTIPPSEAEKMASYLAKHADKLQPQG